MQYILDSVIPQLEADPTKRFTYVEIAFFTRWWNEQSSDMKSRVTKLVNEVWEKKKKLLPAYSVAMNRADSSLSTEDGA